jgi:hypothetical protein
LCRKSIANRVTAPGEDGEECVGVMEAGLEAKTRHP